MSHPQPSSSSAFSSSSRRTPPREWKDNPVNKITVNLLTTYRRINESYYEAKRQHQLLQQQQQQQQQQQSSSSSSSSRDDAEANLIIRSGEELRSGVARYRLDKRIGKGSFGQVVSAVDLTNHNRAVAIKIIKSRPLFTQQAQEEIRFLHRLGSSSSSSSYASSSSSSSSTHIVRLLDTFLFDHHQCLVFERLSMNLYDLLRNTRFQGISFELIRKFSRQILHALEYLRQEQVIHCDLKPENIMLCEPKRSMIKLIDFGSSCELHRRPYTYIQSRFYRAPEIILGLREYTCAIDMWSLGCILVEMHSGEPLFPGQNEREQMHLIVGALGMPPAEMITSGKNTAKFFAPDWRLLDLVVDESKPPLHVQTVDQALGIAPASAASTSTQQQQQKSPYHRWQQKPDVFEGLAKYREFADFVSKMLTYAPSQRITPTEAMQHPFLDPPANYAQQLLQQHQQHPSHHQHQQQQHQPPMPMSASSSPQSTGSLGLGGAAAAGAGGGDKSMPSPKRPSKRPYSQ